MQNIGSEEIQVNNSKNPTVLQASRKVAKLEDAGQEAPVKLCVKKFFIEMA